MIPQTITITPEVHRLYKMSIGRRPPETYAVLAGRLEDPFHVTDFRPMPPMLGTDGRANASTTHIQLNAPFIEHYLNNELIPAGKYLLGIWHSHPGQVRELSRGRPGSGDGDIPSMKGSLERAAQLGRPWKHFLGPITTFRRDGTDDITGWIVTLADGEPIPARVVVKDEAAVDLANNNTAPLYPIHEFRACASVYQKDINLFMADRVSPEEDKQWMAQFWRELCRDDLARKRAAFIEQWSKPGRTP